MSVPTAAINAVHPIARLILLDVKIGGSSARDVTGVTTTHGLSQVNGTCTIEGLRRPGGAEETKTLEVWGGLQTSVGSGTDLIFAGEIDAITWRDFPGQVPLNGRDKFARLRQNWGGEDREYTSQTSAEIIRNLAEAAGFDSSEMNIEEGDWGALGPWTLGTTLPVVAKSGAPFWSLIERIDRLEGMRTFVDRAGKLLRRRISGNLGGSSVWHFEQGENIYQAERTRRLEGIVNHVVVTGLDWLDVLIGGEGVADVRAGNPFLKFPFEYISDPIADSLIEDNDRALAIAKRMVADKNRRPEGFSLTVPFNPRIAPGMVIQITHEKLETQSGGRFLVDQVTHRLGTSPPVATTSITTLGGAIVNVATNIPPVASFAVTFTQESEDTGMAVESRIIVAADGSASYDPDGATLSYAWVLAPDAGTVDPDTGSGATHTAIISGAATAIDITLTVTDADGATGVMGPQTYPLTQGTLQIEPLYLAVDGVFKASVDGEKTWNSYAVAAAVTCTPPHAAAWGTIGGGDDGHIYITNDDWETGVDTGAPHGAVAVTSVWIHELDTTRGWAGFDDGQVWYGEIDSATPDITWSLAGTIPEGPVYEVRESIGALGALYATAGTGYYYSPDSGATWILVHTFVGDARRMLAGFERNWATAVGDVAPVFAEDGAPPTVPGGVTDIPAATFGWRTPAAYAVDETGQLYTTDSTFAALTAHADSSPVAVEHMIRSGSIDVGAPVIYLAGVDATDSGALKWIPGVAAPFYVHRTDADACYMIGYGPTRLPAVAADFVFGTDRLTDPALDGFWRYSFGVWTHIAPPAGTEEWVWISVRAHPYNKNTWLAFGMSATDFTTYGYAQCLELVGTATLRSAGVSPLWLTRDGGATWEEVALPSSGPHAIGGMTGIAWQEQSGRWVAIGNNYNVGQVTGIVWRGTGANDAEIRLLTSPQWRAPDWLASGMGGDMLISESFGPNLPFLSATGRLGYIVNDGDQIAGNTWEADPSIGWEQPLGPIDTVRDGRAFWQINTRGGGDEGICYWEDYRIEDPASVGGLRPNDVDGNYISVAVSTDHVFIASNVTANVGIYRRPHASWEPSGAPDYPTASGMYYVATDRQSRRLMVAYSGGGGSYQFIVHDGNTFSIVALPDPDIGTAHGGAGGLHKDTHALPYAALGEVGLLP